MQISLYTTLFNRCIGGFDFSKFCKTWAPYADEIVVATINDNIDDTLDHIVAESIGVSRYAHKVVICPQKISSSDKYKDGLLKNQALQNCSYDVCIQVDQDELPHGTPGGWRHFARKTLASEDYDTLMLPVLNLYKDKDHYKDISKKWRIHKRYSCSLSYYGQALERGIVNFAKNEDGSIDREKSDTCELIYSDGVLVRAQPMSHELGYFKANLPAVIHTGYLSLEQRAKINTEFWHGEWSSYGPGDPNVKTSIEELEDEEIFEHGLELNL